MLCKLHMIYTCSFIYTADCCQLKDFKGNLQKNVNRAFEQNFSDSKYFSNFSSIK